MKVIEFLFSSFWIWLGAVVMIYATGEAIGYVVKALRK